MRINHKAIDVCRSRRSQVETLEARRLLAAHLISDINRVTDDAQNDYGNMELTTVGSAVYFRADDGIHGPELWRTDGTAAGTSMMKDIDPGVFSDTNTTGYNDGTDVGPTRLTAVGNTLYFTEQDATHGIELWKSDGTSSGTVMVDDLNPGTASSDPDSLTNVNGTLYFTASAAGSFGLYKTDGTPAGTTLITTLQPPQSYSEPAVRTAAFGDRLLYSIDDQTSDTLYETDGTSAGTMPLTDSSGAPVGGLYSATIAVINGVGFFDTNAGIYRTDGTPAGTQLIYNGNAAQLTAVGNLLYFGGLDSKSDLSLNTLNVVTNTVTQVSVLNASAGLSIALMQPFNAGVIFEADSTLPGLWYSDGTTVGTVELAATSSPVDEAGPVLSVIGAKAYFVANDGSHGAELFCTDGTVAGTGLFDDVWPGSQSGLENRTENGDSTNDLLAGPNGELYFTADDGTHGLELWHSDGTVAGTALITDINTNTQSAFPNDAVTAGSKAFFDADDGVHGRQLWVTDGTTAGTQLLSTQASNPIDITAVGNRIFFTATDAVHGSELWTSDGTPAGTTLVDDVVPGADSSNPSDIVAAGSFIYFEATVEYDNPLLNYKSVLFRSDGTAAGTTQVSTLSPSFSFDPQTTVLGSNAYFVAASNNQVDTLYETDGTAAGTVAIASYSGVISGLTAMNGTLYFVEDTFSNVNSLWRTNGTPAGTLLVSNHAPALSSGTHVNLIASGNELFYPASDDSHGTELWKSDGTAAGTQLVDDINPGPQNSSPSNLVAYKSGVAFEALSDSSYLPYFSDGTAAGTMPIETIPGGSIAYGNLIVSGGSLDFTLIVNSTDDQVWQTDGTAAGTTLDADFLLSSSSQLASLFCALPDGESLFSASDAAHGNELWSTDLLASNTASISGTVYDDANGNAKFDTGETGIANITVYNDANNNGVLDPGELSTITDSNGLYSFIGLSAGSYKIRAILPAGYVQTTPSRNYGWTISLKVNQSIIGDNFGQKATPTGGSLSGMVFGGLAGETIYLDANNDSKLDAGELSTTISATGAYSFSDVPIGAYVVRQVLPSGYTQTSPTMNYGDHVTVTAGSSSSGNNFTDASAAHTQLTGVTIGTAGSYNNSGNTIAKATDGNLNTFFDAQASSGNWVGLDLGSSKSISQIAYAPRSGYATRMTGGEFQISTTADFSSGVTTLYTITGTPASGLTTLTLSSPVTARYIRYLSPAGSHGDIAEFQVFS